MLTFSFPYAHGVQSASFDEKNLAEVLEPNQVPLERRSVEQCIREALDTPIGSPRLNEIIRPGETVCIVISDVTRSWQAPKSYLPILVDYKRHRNAPRSNRSRMEKSDRRIALCTYPHNRS